MAASLAETRIVLVPFWRSLPPAEFMAWFRNHANRVPILHVPVGGAALASSLYILSTRNRSCRWPMLRWLESSSLVGFALITTLVHLPANYRLTFGKRSDSEISSLLGRWVRWHDVRLGLLLVSTTAGITALEPADSRS
jgi:hypothetical protein